MMSTKKILSVVSFVLLTVSCQQNLLDTVPYGSIASSNMWANENLAEMGVNGIYSVLRSTDVAGDLYKFDSYGVSGDCRNQGYAILKGTITTSDEQFSGYWKMHYEGISRANDAISHLPSVSMSEEKKNRLLAEAKFLRAFFYYKLNMVFKGVPIYLEPIELDFVDKARNTESEVWSQILLDLDDVISSDVLPLKYSADSGDYGRITKGAAYALRGKVYMWLKEWAKAESDFLQVKSCGYDIFDDGTKDAYRHLFKESNERSNEMIFSLQCIGVSGQGNDFSFRYGSRVTFGSCWNTFLVNTDFVDSYENIDGSKFDWNNVIPGYNEMSPQERAVYFLRDNMTEKEINTVVANQKIDISKYLPNGNEARIKLAYENRDPRLQMTVITPYSTYLGSIKAKEYTYTLRYPYRGYDTEEPFDLRTNTNSRFYYLFRKFVAEGASEIPDRSYSPIDIPIIRYADVALSMAECLNEQDRMDEAVEWVNVVRKRARIAELNSNQYTRVIDKDDMRERIRNERRWEFAGEGVNFFDEIRWHTWKESKFSYGAGLKQIWGEPQYTHSWAGDYIYTWAIPRSEIQMNPNLKQNENWPID